VPSVPVKVVALTQEHHGHGVSTAAYFLAAAFARQQVPVLLADLTGRREHLHQLSARLPAHNVVVWSPPTRALHDVPTLLTRVREQVQGKATCVLLDIDRVALDERATGIDYLLIACASTPEAQKSADRLALEVPSLHERDHIGVVFARVGPEEESELPSTTPEGLPVVGFWPADYRLAMAEEDSTVTPGEPQQSYLGALARLAARLIRLVPLSRL
jgi:hypothetical protein